MRWMRVIALLILVTAGCGRKGPPPAAEAVPNGQALTPAPVEQGWESPPADGPVFQGRTAPQWSQLMENRDAGTRVEATIALGKLGEKGYPYLARGLKNSSDDVRLASLSAMGKPELVGHRQETLPILFDMLNARNPLVRQAAACRLAWYGIESQRALQPLQRLAERDDDPEVRRVAASAIVEIEEVIKTGGVITRGQPLKK